MFVRLSNLCILFASCIALAVGEARGQVAWKQTSAELRAPPGVAAETVLGARYSFENTGSSPVEISSVQSDCSCTVPETAKRRYEPGEKGEIRVRFTVGERMGREEKHVLVTLAGQKEPTKLTLVVFIPELLQVDPEFVAWKRGEEKTARTIVITAGEGVTLKKLSVHSSQLIITPELKLVEYGRRYQLTVTPARTDLPLVALLSLSGEFDVLGSVAGDEKDERVMHASVNKVVTVNANVK